MPLYDYRCTECGHEIEVMHAIDGAGPATCDVCGGAMRKALSPPAIVFKGSGWAKKDARSAATATSKPKSTGGESTGGEAKGDGGSDAKEGGTSKPAGEASKGAAATTGGTAAD